MDTPDNPRKMWHIAVKGLVQNTNKGISSQKALMEHAEILTYANHLFLEAYQYDQRAKELLDDARWCREAAVTYANTHEWRADVTALIDSAKRDEQEARQLRQRADWLRHEASQLRNQVSG